MKTLLQASRLAKRDVGREVMEGVLCSGGWDGG